MQLRSSGLHACATRSSAGIACHFRVKHNSSLTPLKYPRIAVRMRGRKPASAALIRSVRLAAEMACSADNAGSGCLCALPSDAPGAI
eukprot:3286110-Pleurochrysis_carterae.AAC.1